MAAVDRHWVAGATPQYSAALPQTPDYRLLGVTVMEKLIEQIGVALRRRLLLPLLPIVAGLVLALTVHAREQEKPIDVVAKAAENKQVQQSAEELRKRIEKRQQQATEKGLKDDENLFKEIN